MPSAEALAYYRCLRLISCNALQKLHFNGVLNYLRNMGTGGSILKGAGQASAVLAPLKGSTWQDSDVLYPIPLAEIIENSKIKQNAGY